MQTSDDLETLLPYQLTGAAFLAERKQAMLADTMGLGKTAQAIAACDMVGAEKVLVLCPSIAKYNWQREFSRFSFLDRDSQVIEKKADRPAARLVIATFDTAADAKMQKALSAVQFDVLILDEAHYLKSRTASRTKAIYGKRCDGKMGIAATCGRVWRLTGTPIPNYPSEFWTHLRSAGVYAGDYHSFERTFCAGYDSDYGFKVTGSRNEDELKKLLEGFMLRRVDKGDLPPLTYATVTVPKIELTEQEYATYFTSEFFSNARGALVAEISRQARVISDGFAAITRAKSDAFYGASASEKQLELLKAMAESTAQLRRYVGIVKCKTVVPLLVEELKSGAIDKLVVFSYHKTVMDALKIGLEEFKPVFVSGSVSAPRRERAVRAFESGAGGCRVYLGQIIASGTAVTLTSACEVAMLELDYVPGNNAQAIMRVHRIGQDRPVRVRTFAIAGSIDEQITKILRMKLQSQLKILG